jgi:hypothetical protein
MQTGEPIILTLHTGGDITQEAFHQRRKITLNALVQEESLELYAANEDVCVKLGQTLGKLLHEYLSEDAKAACAHPDEQLVVEEQAINCLGCGQRWLAA